MAEPFDKSTTQEAHILEKLSRIENSPADYFAVHLHLSKLRAANRQQHFLNIAARSFDNLVNSADAILYTMMTGDMALLCHDVMVDDIDPYITKVRSLFSEDPLTDSEDDFEDTFCTWYDLSSTEDFAAFLSAMTELSVQAEILIEERRRGKADENQKNQGEPLTAKNLAVINQKLQVTRIADLIKHQTCIRIKPGSAGEVVFREHYIAVSELKDRIAPGVNLFTSAWLFQFLTETLDKRMLAVMSRRDFAEMDARMSINLNVATVLSRDFAQFNRMVGEHADKIVIEMQIIDIFADMNTFGYARDMLQERGYRVVADGINPLSLQFFDPATLRTDFLKIAWGKEFEGDATDGRLDNFKETVRNADADSIVLSRVDSEKAVKWGQALGINRFQGYFIDKLVEAMSRSKVKPKARTIKKTSEVSG